MIEAGEEAISRMIGSGERFVLVFYRPDCPVCKKYMNTLKIASDMGVKIVTVNIKSRRDLAKRFGIVAVPTTIIYDGGKPRNVYVGPVGIEKIIALKL